VVFFHAWMLSEVALAGTCTHSLVDLQLIQGGSDSNFKFTILFIVG
jgi:hypothetical protein